MTTCRHVWAHPAHLHMFKSFVATTAEKTILDLGRSQRVIEAIERVVPEKRHIDPMLITPEDLDDLRQSKDSKGNTPFANLAYNPDEKRNLILSEDEWEHAKSVFARCVASGLEGRTARSVIAMHTALEKAEKVEAQPK